MREVVMILLSGIGLISALFCLLYALFKAAPKKGIDQEDEPPDTPLFI